MFYNNNAEMMNDNNNNNRINVNNGDKKKSGIDDCGDNETTAFLVGTRLGLTSRCRSLRARCQFIVEQAGCLFCCRFKPARMLGTLEWRLYTECLESPEL